MNRKLLSVKLGGDAIRPAALSLSKAFLASATSRVPRMSRDCAPVSTLTGMDR